MGLDSRAPQTPIPGPARAVADLRLLPANVAEHVGMNVEADVGDVVEVLARRQPDDLADGALGVMLAELRQRLRPYSFSATLLAWVNR